MFKNCREMSENAVVIRERVIPRKSSQLGNVASLVMLYVNLLVRLCLAEER
jgi:hypothetical protein